MIKGLCKEGLVDEAENLLTNLEQNGSLLNSCTYNVFVQGLLFKRVSSKTMKYLKVMKEKGFVADAATTEMLVNYASTNQEDIAF
ncbi:hypothetical protein K1719_030355 [Acacia pycnantha]|nr:hypothetical protein K1719_030355 [Acacia pycnantha]